MNNENLLSGENLLDGEELLSNEDLLELTRFSNNRVRLFCPNAKEIIRHYE